MVTIIENVSIRIYKGDEVLYSKSIRNSFTDIGKNYLRDVLSDSGASIAEITNMLLTHTGGTSSQSTTYTTGNGLVDFKAVWGEGSELITTSVALRNGTNDVYSSIPLVTTKPTTYSLEINWRVQFT